MQKTILADKGLITDDEILFTEGEYSTWSNIPVRTLQAWRQSGKGPPYIKLGKHVRYPKGACKKHHYEHTYKSTTEETVGGT